MWGLLLWLGLAWPPAVWAAALPPFRSPYASGAPLESFLVFTAPPRVDVPDGQIHWTGPEVPGIDVLGPDGEVRVMCPEGGQAWSLAGGDPFGGEQFVAVECAGQAEGWQMLAFHLCKVRIRFSIETGQKIYTQVAAGEVIADECGGHTHLSLGYWASENQKRDLPCPQWYVQGRYWVNPACLTEAQHLPPIFTLQLNLSEDWELQFLTPSVLTPLRWGALWVVGLSLGFYLLRGGLWKPLAPEQKHKRQPLADTLAHTGIWLLFLVLLILISAGPVWPVGGVFASGYPADDAPYKVLAQQVGYSDWQLLKAFYQVAVPRDANGHPVPPGSSGKIFPPAAAAAIPFGETNAAAWGLTDPTESGAHGQYNAWEAVANRWPPNFYEHTILGLPVSLMAQQQQAGLQAIANNLALQALGERLGKPIRPQALYGSSAGAVGRTQILPGYFAPGALCGDLASMDVWNDPVAIAECTTRYLATSGCWGDWWFNGDVWSALCSYNPGAWDVAAHQWYWNVLQDRMTRLTAAQAQLQLTANRQPASQNVEGHVATPILGLLVTQALLQEGYSPYHLPGPLNEWLVTLAPSLQAHRAWVHGAYRLFRAWILIFYPPEQLLAMGVQL